MNETNHPDPRMHLTLKDMPVYKGEIECLVGETRNHFYDHHESRWQKPGNDK